MGWRDRATETIDAEAQSMVYAQQVATGAKLAASMMVPNRATRAASMAAQREGCSVLEYKDGEWTTLWIYKYPFVRLLIDHKQSCVEEQERPSAFGIWSTGKLFGYSDYEIAKFLEQHGYIECALGTQQKDG